MEITDEMLAKVTLTNKQKEMAFDAVRQHAGQQHKPSLALYANDAVKALKIIEIQSKGAGANASSVSRS